MFPNVFMKSFVMSEGERYCLLVEKSTGLPLYFPNLFVSTQVRNRSLSFSAMQSALSGIAVLLKFMFERDENIEDRFKKKQFLETNEFDAIKDFCQIKFSNSAIKTNSSDVFTLAELREFDEKVSSQTEYVRLTVVSHYVKWLAEMLSGESRDKNVSLNISKMAKGLEARRPVKKNRNSGLVEKGLDEKQLELLFELFRLESEFNPFTDNSVRVRNRLMFLLLYHLGIRGGELLYIRIKDIDFNQNQLLIIRRADEKDDPRIDQSHAKTLDRRIPLKETLIKEIHNYILNYRRLVVGPRQPDFLFVTHKPGPTKGLPITISGYRKVMTIVRMAFPELYNLSGHRLRHAWNEQFSELMDSMDNSPTDEKQEEIRSYLMGWKSGSGTAATYNQRFIKRKGHEAALKLQAGMVRLPKDLSNE